MLPPRIIHHIWLCHQLHPLRYKSDCMRLLGGILGHDNSNFCLHGCSVFHKLWEDETGAPWPSQEDLRQEAEGARDLPEIIPNHDDSALISANLWHNYDSLARIYDEIHVEAPDLFPLGTERSTSLLNEARLDYARFLIAASYAAKVGMMVTPSGPIDLIWHTHQTNPESYDDAIRQEFSTGPIDHVPCGALNPPPENGTEWLEMTDKIWTELYGHGVNVQGTAIHCCTPKNPRPEGAVVEESELRWWFSILQRLKVSDPNPLTRPANVEGFPTNGQIARYLGVGVEEQLSEGDLPVYTNVFQPLVESMGGTFSTLQDDLRAVKGSVGYKRRRCVGISSIILSCLLIVSSFVYGGLNKMVDPIEWVIFWSFYFAAFLLIFGWAWAGQRNTKSLEACDNAFWERIQAHIIIHNAVAAEYGICIEFRQELMGPINPIEPENDRYKGRGIAIFSLPVLFDRLRAQSGEGGEGAS